jgi:hypothetical protein
MTITGPTTFFHRTRPPRVVRTDEEYAALGEGWADTPAAFYEKPDDAKPPRPTRKPKE